MPIYRRLLKPFGMWRKKRTTLLRYLGIYLYRRE